MTPLQTLLICELSPRPDVDRNHSAASVHVPKTMPVSMHITDFACAWADCFSGVSKRAKALIRAFSLAFGFENCFKVVCRTSSLDSAEENCLIAACRNFSLTLGFAITTLCRALWAALYSGFSKRALALALKLVRHSGDQRIFRCFAFVSSETTQPEAPSPPSVRLQSPWSWYFKISSRSSSNAHHSCIPVCTISMV